MPLTYTPTNMPTFDEYNKMNKKELINLLIEKDKTVKDLQDRIGNIEKQIKESDVSQNH